MNAKEQLQKIHAELTILEALILGIDRRDEVFDAVENSENDQQASLAVCKLLGIDSVQARAILDMQVRRFTHAQRQKLEEHVAQLKSGLTTKD